MGFLRYISESDEHTQGVIVVGEHRYLKSAAIDPVSKVFKLGRAGGNVVAGGVNPSDASVKAVADH